jgi:Tol biopolymer transport system component
MAADGSKFYYCSDYKTGKPHIYCYEFATNSAQPIIEQGYCYCPSYCAPRRQVAYCKMMSGQAQLFVYDELTKEHVQLTFDGSSKDECSWSPCGNFLLFAVEQKGKSRVAMLNLLTNERRYLTAESEVCTYPTWSPIYNEFPSMT